MTKKNPASLRISSENYRIADLVIAIAFLFSGMVGGYFAIVDGVRDFWLLLVVGVVGTVLMFRRSRASE